MPKSKRNVDGEEIQTTGKPNTGCGCVRPHRILKGRKEIFTSADRINSANVVDVLQKALNVHSSNRADTEYLYNYLRGVQPVVHREKKYNKEICNRIVVNIAQQIVAFKVAQLVGSPIQYVSRGTDETVPEKIEKLNSFMISEGKEAKDVPLAYWMFTSGVGYRLTLRDKAEKFMAGELFDEAPFEFYILDPRNTFVVRKNDVTRRLMMGVTYVFTEDKKISYTVYTENETFYITAGFPGGMKITSSVKHNFGAIPITEYPCNPLRMGAFEVVIDLLDAINTITSNRIDGVEQFIQALMVFENADITREQFLELKDLGAIKLPSVDGRTSRVYYLNEQLDQSQTQTLIDDMKYIIYEIVGMPTQGHANTSDSSNNGAILMKNGFWNADSRKTETEAMLKSSEMEFQKIVLKICRDSNALDLKVSDIETRPAKSRYEDVLVKTQSFQSLISAGCPPFQAYAYSGLDSDPEAASMLYESYRMQREEELEKQLERQKPT